MCREESPGRSTDVQSSMGDEINEIRHVRSLLGFLMVKIALNDVNKVLPVK